MIHPLNCREVTTRLALGDVPSYRWLDRVMIRFHLAICWVCRKYERQMRMIGRAFAQAAEQKGQSLISSDFKDRLVKHLSAL